MVEDGFDIKKINVTIIGLGVIGASMAMAIKKLSPKNIWGIDIDSQTIAFAEEKKMIDQGFLDPQAVLKKTDLLIMAIYPEATIDFIKKNQQYLPTGAIITDTAGIKTKLVKEIKEFLRSDLEFIPGHPMAGKEGRGIEVATDEIYRNATYILTPENQNQAKLDFWQKIIKDIGFKKIIITDPVHHDAMIAYTSQLPHIIAVAMINGHQGPGNPEDYSGGSYRDITRVAVINEDLWQELFLDNKEALLTVLESFSDSLAVMKKGIKENDAKVLMTEMEKARLTKVEELK